MASQNAAEWQPAADRPCRLSRARPGRQHSHRQPDQGLAGSRRRVEPSIRDRAAASIPLTAARSVVAGQNTGSGFTGSNGRLAWPHESAKQVSSLEQVDAGDVIRALKQFGTNLQQVALVRDKHHANQVYRLAAVPVLLRVVLLANLRYRPVKGILHP